MSVEAPAVADIAVNGHSPPIEQRNGTPNFADFPKSPREFVRNQIGRFDEHLFDGPKALVEYLMAVNEVSGLMLSPIYRDESVPRGNGERLIIMPGFGAAGWMYFPAIYNFRMLGYDAVAFPLRYGLNIEPTGAMVDQIMDYLESESQKAGEKVDVMLHSKAGHGGLATYAKHKERFIKSVDQVLIFGSVIPTEVNMIVSVPYVATQFVFGENDFGLVEMIRRDPSILDMEGVRGTFVYIPREGIIKGIPFCKPEDQFEVGGSHYTMLARRDNLIFAANRLARPKPLEETFQTEILPFPIKAAA